MINRPVNSSTSILGCDADLALLSMDGLKLVLPQSAIQSIEPVLDVEECDQNAAIAGFLVFEGERRPVHCLSKDFTALQRMPEARRVCVVLSSAQGYFCLLCDSVRLLKREHAKMTPLPACMDTENSPFQGLAILDQGMGCLSSVDHLVAYVRTLSANEPRETGASMPDSRLEQRLG